MQASTQPNPPLPTETPLAPDAPVSITIVGADGKTQQLTVPSSTEEMQALLAQRRELNNQLSTVAGRRSSLAREIATTSNGATRAGLEARIRLLDQRILQIETDLSAVGRQISSAPAQLIASTQPPQGVDSEFAPGFATGGVVVASVFGIVIAWRRFKRRRAAPPPATPPMVASDQRLDRLEHGIEAIAIEIERVSEGQRFVTKLLAENAPIAASNRIAQP